MIEDLRFVDGYIPAPEFGDNYSRKIKKLQAKINGEWQDVRYEDEANEAVP